MISLIAQELKSIKNDKDRFNFLREFLQILILSIIDEAGYFRNLSFIGGTALRIVHRINRYSEDLDFSLIDPNNYSFVDLIEKLLRELKLRGLKVNTKKIREKSTVQSVFFRFSELLYEAGLSPLKEEKLFIKFEIDSNPPLGYKTELHTLTDPLLFNVLVFDKPSLMAGKLHAILQRKYEKGRDYYDLLWYLLSGVEPNLDLLNNSLKQTTGQYSDLKDKAWKNLLLDKISNANFELIRDDISPFLIYDHELKSISKESFVRALERVG
jgi:predicted nucleotidyltransferase component of viral defense system